MAGGGVLAGGAFACHAPGAAGGDAGVEAGRQLAAGQLRRMAEAAALQMRYLQGPLLRAQGAFGDMTKGVGAGIAKRGGVGQGTNRSEENTSELQSLMRNSYAGFC